MRVSGLFSYSNVLYENRSSIPFLSKIEVVSPSFMQKFEAERLSRSCRVRKNLFTLEQVAGRKVKNITKTEDHLCFGETCTTFIIADRTGGNAKLFCKCLLCKSRTLSGFTDKDRCACGFTRHIIHLDQEFYRKTRN